MIEIRPNVPSALSDSDLQRNLRHTLSEVAESRQVAVSEVDNWQELRNYAHTVKAHTIAHLDRYLKQLEDRVTEQGGKVLWAEDATEAVQHVLSIIQANGITKLVKSKSMLTEEIRLNRGLEHAHIRPIETDLGEYIVQIAGEVPSHIVMPAMHMSRTEIADLFVSKLGMTPTQDVERITATARRLLREHFLTSRMGITGVNFGVAETGTVVVVENEGNAKLTTSVPEIHIAMMGIEKVLPRVTDLSVFLKLLTRNATGQKISTYVNGINGSRREAELDGPREFYLVLVDNGRSRILQDDYFRQTLHCIRCGACLDVCPVYQSIGGHAYGSTYQGPIGSVLTPQLVGIDQAPEHPFASSLCGACFETCPVKIEIPHLLLALRQKVSKAKGSRATSLPLEKWAMQMWAWAFSSPRRFAGGGRWARRLQKTFMKGGILPFSVPAISRWSKARELPVIPEDSFRALYSKTKESEE